MLVLTFHYVDILNSVLQFLKSITMETEYWLLDNPDQEVMLISLASTFAASVSNVLLPPRAI